MTTDDVGKAVGIDQVHANRAYGLADVRGAVHLVVLGVLDLQYRAQLLAERPQLLHELGAPRLESLPGSGEDEVQRHLFRCRQDLGAARDTSDQSVEIRTEPCRRVALQGEFLDQRLGRVGENSSRASRGGLCTEQSPCMNLQSREVVLQHLTGRLHGETVGDERRQRLARWPISICCARYAQREVAAHA